MTAENRNTLYNRKAKYPKIRVSVFVFSL